MLGMSGTELVIILALALLLLGPDQLPSVAKMLGKGMREIRKATDDLKSTFEQEMVKLDDEPKAPRMIPPVLDSPGAPADSYSGGPLALHESAPLGLHESAPLGLHESAPLGLHESAPLGSHESAPLGGDPAAARAAARNAAAPADPGAARAAARMAATGVLSPTDAAKPTRMAPPAGAVPRSFLPGETVAPPSVPVALPESEEPKA